MPRATVRTAVAAWLAPPAVTGLATVYAARPKIVAATDYALSAGPGFGAVCIVHITESDEVRVALGGPTSGKKHVAYKVALELLFQSVLPRSEDGFAAHDRLIDAIIERLRADRTLGTDGQPIWQAGEGRAGITVEMSEPTLTPQALSIEAVIRFDAIEEVTS